MTDVLLVTTLQVAVPLWIAKSARYDEPTRRWVLEQWRRGAVDAVAYRGDVIQFGSSRRGDSASAFNDLARGVAALAHQLGGVCAFGLVWCAAHSPGGALPTTGQVCAACLTESPEMPEAPVGPLEGRRPIEIMHLPAEDVA